MWVNYDNSVDSSECGLKFQAVEKQGCGREIKGEEKDVCEGSGD